MIEKKEHFEALIRKENTSVIADHTKVTGHNIEFNSPFMKKVYAAGCETFRLENCITPLSLHVRNYSVTFFFNTL